PVGNVALYREHYASGPIVTPLPGSNARGGIDQLRVDPDLTAFPLERAFQNVTYAKILADPTHVNRLALVDLGRVAGDDREIRIARKIGDDVRGDTVGQTAVRRIAGEVVKWQDGDRGRGYGVRGAPRAV